MTTKPSRTDAPAALFLTPCLRLGRMVYVPTYHDRQLYALPGGGVVSALALQDKGAVPCTEMLLKREENKE